MADRTDLYGRATHLTKLVAMFKRANLRYVDLYDFLDDFFLSRNGMGTRGRGFHALPCRHGVNGKHNGPLQQASSEVPISSELARTFDHQRYWAPCVGFGAGEVGKAPGVVVYDLLTKAGVWITRQRCGQNTSRSLVTQTDNRSRAQPSDIGAELDIDAQLLAEVDQYLLGQGVGVAVTPSSPDAMSEVSSPTTSISTRFFGSPTVLQTDPSGGRRVSTAIRVHTLMYIISRGRTTVAVRSALEALVTGDQNVLHLCGCGLWFQNERGETCSGCVQPLHLELGSQTTNLRHEVWHKAMQTAQVADYPTLCGIAHRAVTGDCAHIF